MQFGYKFYFRTFDSVNMEKALSEFKLIMCNLQARYLNYTTNWTDTSSLTNIKIAILRRCILGSISLGE